MLAIKIKRREVFSTPLFFGLVETENRDNILLELSSVHAPGDQYGPNFSKETRIGESFAKTGKTLGKLMWKKGMK